MSVKRDTLLVSVSDFHSGSNFALFLNRQWYGRRNMTHLATGGQVQIRRQFETFAAEVKAARKNKRVILVHNGDAIDGDHHHSGDVCTTNELEQANIHVELMRELKRSIDWQSGDKLYYTRGTETHVHEKENYIGEKLRSVKCGDWWVHDLLELDINGVRVNWVHHGPRRGEGANEGNSVRNWLRNIYYDATKDGALPPHIVYTGHVHDPTYSTYVYRIKMIFETMHGIVLPSWQGKTAHAWKAASMSRNKVGGVYQEVKADGTICVPRFSVMLG